jgi:F1F0 ATPase subunit 2
MSLVGAYGILAGLAAGAVAGGLHFAALEMTVRCFVAGRALRAFCLQAIRFALVAAVFYGLAQLGAGPLLAGLAGLLGARHAMLRSIGGVP